ncbi:MAG: nitrogen fixation protein [Magnetospirillum sp.]|nr:nitrogen fixation protein [Magnetospirillum sp.]
MKIAVASQNWTTITAHPGKTGRFRVFEAAPGQPPQELERIDLPKERTLHHVRDDGPHPLYDLDVIIAGSAGSGFVNRLMSRGVTVVTTSEKDPLEAIRRLFAGTLPPAEPHGH